MRQHIPHPHRRIPVPRRVLRYLARCPRRTHIATVLGHLVRCLYCRRGQCQPVGFCAASWIATVFGLSLRSVKTARQHLEQLGLLQRLPTPQWVRTRYGQKIALNLQWEGLSHQHADAQDTPGAADAKATSSLDARSSAGVTSAGDPSTRLPVVSHPDPAPPPAGANHHRPASPFAPPLRETTQVFAPPDSHRELSARIAHQEPVAGRPAGPLSTLVREARAALRAGDHRPADTAPALSSPRRLVPPPSSPPSVHRRPSPAVRPATSPARPTVATASTAQRSANAPPLHSVPTLRHITRHDLRDTRRILQLYAQAVTAGLIAPSEANRLTVVALAQHVLAQQPANPGGLFWYLLTTRQFSLITQAEEDAAQQQLKTLLYGNPREDWRR